MFNNFFFKKVLTISSLVFLYSCDKDYNTIGGDLLQSNNFAFEKETLNVVAFNEQLDSIQTNNQLVNPFGIFKDDIFGTTTANVVTQLNLATENLVFKDPASIDVKSVVLSIPYIIDVSKIDLNNTINNSYLFYSIYGNSTGGFKLNVFRSGYSLNLTEATNNITESTPPIYSRFNNLFDTNKFDGIRLNDSKDGIQNDNFNFTSPDKLKESNEPTLKLDLNATYFKSVLKDANSLGVLKANYLFRRYFQGLYFQAEDNGSGSSLALLNFKKGTVTISYTADGDVFLKTLVLNMDGNSVSLLNQSVLPTNYANAIKRTNVDKNLGDPKLFVKGGVGSMAVVKLNQNDFTSIKTKGWFINEANLIFYVDENFMKSDFRPQRLYLYDLINSKPVNDYLLDNTRGSNDKNGKIVFGGILSKDASGKLFYKFRLTNYVRSLIDETPKEIKLGLVVTDDINSFDMAKLERLTTTTSINQIPKASVTNPLGVVLFGNNISTINPDYNNRLKMEIFYTKTN